MGSMLYSALQVLHYPTRARVMSSPVFFEPAGATPAMRQYFDAKRQYRDAIVFFRMGDFYEMFYEDALTAARALELTLTSRSKRWLRPPVTERRSLAPGSTRNGGKSLRRCTTRKDIRLSSRHRCRRSPRWSAGDQRSTGGQCE